MNYSLPLSMTLPKLKEMPFTQISHDKAIKSIEKVLHLYEQHTPDFLVIEESIMRFCAESKRNPNSQQDPDFGDIVKATMLSIYNNLEANRLNLLSLKRRVELIQEGQAILSS